MLGFEDNELPNTQSTWIDLIHPEDSDAAPHQSIRRKPDESRPFNLEFRMRTRDGEYQWLQSRGVQKFDQDGKLSRVIGVHLDIQERKEIEEETHPERGSFLRLPQSHRSRILRPGFSERHRVLLHRLAQTAGLLGSGTRSDPQGFPRTAAPGRCRGRSRCLLLAIRS